VSELINIGPTNLSAGLDFEGWTCPLPLRDSPELPAVVVVVAAPVPVPEDACPFSIAVATMSIELRPFRSFVATRSGTSSAMKPTCFSFGSSLYAYCTGCSSLSAHIASSPERS